MWTGSLCVFLQLLAGGWCHTAADVRRLVDDLFLNSSYNANIRPKWNQSEQTEVSLELSIGSISDFDLTTAEMAVTGYYKVSWLDEFLVWNATDYGGLSKLVLKRGQFWLPKLTLVHETSGGSDLIQTSISPAFIYHTGRVFWFPAGNFYGRCTIDTALFPFDTHQCEFSVVLMEYDLTEVSIVVPKSAIELRNLTDHGEWRIVATRSRATSGGDPDTGIQVCLAELLVQVERLPSFIIIHALLPISFVCCLHLLVSLVPVDSGERLSCSVTLFLAMVLQMSDLVEKLPNNSNYVSVYSMVLLLLNSLGTVSVAASIAFVRLSRRSVEMYPIPGCLNSVTSKFLLWRKRKGKDPVSSSPAKVAPLEETRDEDNGEDSPPVENKTGNDVTWLQVTEIFDLILFAVNSTIVLVFVAVMIATFCIQYSDRYNSFK